MATAAAFDEAAVRETLRRGQGRSSSIKDGSDREEEGRWRCGGGEDSTTATSRRTELRRRLGVDEAAATERREPPAPKLFWVGGGRIWYLGWTWARSDDLGYKPNELEVEIGLGF